MYTNITKMRYVVVIVIGLSTLYFIRSRYDYTNKQNHIEILDSNFQKILPAMDLEIKEQDQEQNQKNKEPTHSVKNIILQSTEIHNSSDTNTKGELNQSRNDSMSILIWTRPNHDPLMFLLRGQEAFIKRQCKVKSCYITTDKSYLSDLSDFDVVLFNGPDIVNKKHPKLPSNRSPRQNYVFASIESSDYYPICDNRFDGYFNISWTYKLNSDIFYGYLIIRNSEGEVIGPQQEMHWMSMDEMKPINKTLKEKLSSKKKLAAWMVSNCKAPSGRDRFVKNVQAELKSLGTDMTVDVYGKCGTFSCYRQQMDNCLQMFEDDYYFYFSFENSFAEDYVTEKLLHPLQHYAVPVVYGTANYTRFMPEGIYLNALELGEKELAKRMLEIAADKEQYYNYFKWRNHYSFHYVEEAPETDFFCKFCEAMNDDNLMKGTTVIQNFKEWWNPPKIRKGACPPRY